MNVKFKGWDCKVLLTKYPSSGRPAIVLNDAATGERVAVATVNIHSVYLAEGETLIKDYSENEGILDVLVRAKIVSPPSEWVPTGFVKVARVTINEAAFAS